VAVVLASYLVWQPRPDRTRSRSQGYAAAVDRAEVERMIGALEAEVRDQPSVTRLNQLAQLYLQRARTTGDIQNYLQAQTAIDRSLAMAPADIDARGLEASFRYATHDFVGAFAVAKGIVDQDAAQLGALATMGDAQLELGSYAEAAAVYARLEAAEPDAAATDVRLARLAYLQGRVDEALRMAATAEANARAAALGGPSLAFYQAARGQVQLDTGHYDDAARSFVDALEEAPGYFVAFAGLARTRAAQSHRSEAARLFEEAVATQPQPDAVAALGDLYRLEGDGAKADKEYGTVEVIATLAKLNQQVYNRLLALFYADHELRPDEALRLAAGELTVRKDVFGYDAYAWALHGSGRDREARQAADQALAQGTSDARILYHAGMISKALGDTARAREELGRALALSPRFDPLQAPRARAALDELKGRR
jgi:tetratricopeptide (TPR) repeat protein